MPFSPVMNITKVRPIQKMTKHLTIISRMLAMLSRWTTPLTPLAMDSNERETPLLAHGRESQDEDIHNVKHSIFESIKSYYLSMPSAIARFYASGLYNIVTGFFYYGMHVYAGNNLTRQFVNLYALLYYAGSFLSGIIAAPAALGGMVPLNQLVLWTAIGNALTEVVYLLYPSENVNYASIFFHGFFSANVPFGAFFSMNYRVAPKKYLGLLSSDYLIASLIASLSAVGALLLADGLLVWTGLPMGSYYLARLLLLPATVAAAPIALIYPSFDERSWPKAFPLPKFFRFGHLSQINASYVKAIRIFRRKPFLIPAAGSAFVFGFLGQGLLLFAYIFLDSFTKVEESARGVFLFVLLVAVEILGIVFGIVIASMIADYLGSRSTLRMLLVATLVYIALFPFMFLYFLFSSSVYFTLVLLFVLCVLLFSLAVWLPLAIMSCLESKEDEDLLFSVYSSCYLTPVALGYMGFVVFFEVLHIIWDVQYIVIFIVTFTVALIGPALLLLAVVWQFLLTEREKKAGKLLSSDLDEMRGTRNVRLPQGTKALFDAYSQAHASWVISSSDIVVEKHLGSGAFASVKKGRWKKVPVAVKVLHEILSEEETVKGFVKEVELMALLRHPNIVTFFGAVFEEGSACLVSELCCCNLYDYLRDKTVVNKLAPLAMAQDVTSGIVYLHSLSPAIIHRDLKSLNVLVGSENRLKLCDFGESRAMSSINHTMTMVGTPMWSAPEVLLCERYGKAIDIYSLAIVLVEIVTCEDPYPLSTPPVAIIAGVMSGKRPVLPSWIRNDVSQLIQSCWKQEPSERPAAHEVEDVLSSMTSWDFVERAQDGSLIVTLRELE